MKSCTLPLTQWQETIAELDRTQVEWLEKNRVPVDMRISDYLKNLPPCPFQKDQKLRARFHEFVEQLAAAYLEASPEECEVIRSLVKKFRGFWWSLCLP